MAIGNFYLESDRGGRAIKTALKWLLDSPNRTVYLAVIQNDIVQNALRDVLPQGTLRDLIKRRSAILDGHEIILVTHHRMLGSAVPTRLLALYPDPSFLDELDAIHSISEMLVVPWIPGEIENWRLARNAVALGTASTPRTHLHLDDPVVEAAIRYLGKDVNQANGLVGGRDKETTIQIFKILHEAHLDYSPDQIKAFLISECGWEAPIAERAKEIALQIMQRKALRSGQLRFVPNILDIWREESRRSSQ